MGTDETIAAVAIALLSGSGGMWAWMTSRGKSGAEASSIATDAALRAQAAVLDSLKNRVTEMEDEKRAGEIQAALDLAVMRDSLSKAEKERQYFSDHLAQVQAEFRQAQADCERAMDEFRSALATERAARAKERAELYAALDTERAARADVERKLAAYLRRFPQFDEGFKRPGTAPLGGNNG
jgi:chromosome segregation ATPase